MISNPRIVPVGGPTGFQTWLAVLASAVLLLGVYYGATGVRGSDQFWYIADVETLASGNPPYSNHYYPGTLLRKNGQQESLLADNYFIHNGPVLSIVSALANVFDAYTAWILFNLACHLLTAFLIYRFCRDRIDQTLGAGLSILYLLSPLAVWQSVNALVESFLAALLALSLVSFADVHLASNRATGSAPRTSAFFSIVTLVMSLAIGVLSHPMFLVLSIAYAVYLLVMSRSMRNQYLSVIGAGALLAGLFFLNRHSSNWFPTMSSIGILDFKVGVLPAVSNMLMYHTDQLISLDMEIFLLKIIDAVEMQFFNVQNSVLLLYTNLGLLAFFYLAFRHMRKYAPLLLVFFICYGLHAAVLVLHQNQFRYAHVITFVSFICIALAIQELRPARQKIIVAGALALALNLGLSAMLVNKSHKEGVEWRSRIDALSQEFEALEEDARVVTLSEGLDISLAYTLRPRPTLTINPTFLDETKIQVLLDRFEPDYVIAAKPQTERYSQSFQEVKKIAVGTMGSLVVYRVEL